MLTFMHHAALFDVEMASACALSSFSITKYHVTIEKVRLAAALRMLIVRDSCCLPQQIWLLRRRNWALKDEGHCCKGIERCCSHPLGASAGSLAHILSLVEYFSVEYLKKVTSLASARRPDPSSTKIALLPTFFRPTNHCHINHKSAISLRCGVCIRGSR